MSHAAVLVLVPAAEPVEGAVERLMKPYDENGHGGRQGRSGTRSRGC